MLKLLDLLGQYKAPDGNLVCLLGQTDDGQNIWMDLSANPHMLVAGTTGSGKSVLLHNIVANMLHSDKCVIDLVDPKNIEFFKYEQLNNKDVRVYYSYEEALDLLDTLIAVMEKRYQLIRDGVTTFPPILIIIDELADLIMQDEGDKPFFKKLCRLSQKCRAANISIILATQRPSVNIINGAIKANFPARIACRVSSRVDSRVILDQCGAEKLIGKGDSLLKDNFRDMQRFQVAYTDADEVCKKFGNR
jgi:S-DNA-T family DNA segregation ATPase FtsK/SpoIIIE